MWRQEWVSILSNMDSETAELEAQIAKTRALKQGMMQQLPTGTVRLGAAGPSPAFWPRLIAGRQQCGRA
jgi:restriction endonuclease S subunit